MSRTCHALPRLNDRIRYPRHVLATSTQRRPRRLSIVPRAVQIMSRLTSTDSPMSWPKSFPMMVPTLSHLMSLQRPRQGQAKDYGVDLHRLRQVPAAVRSVSLHCPFAGSGIAHGRTRLVLAWTRRDLIEFPLSPDYVHATLTTRSRLVPVASTPSPSFVLSTSSDVPV